MTLKTQFGAAAILLTAVSSLSACQSGAGTPSASGTSTSTPTSTGTIAGAPRTPVIIPTRTTVVVPTPKASVTASPSAADPHARSDTYAFSHLCTRGQLTMTVTTMASAPSRRLITVHNIGRAACGLDYFPHVDIGRSTSQDSSANVKPWIPGGLGGPPAFPIYAGARSYAVVDLNPRHATRSVRPGLDEMNVLAVSSMPKAATRNFKLGSGVVVNRPLLGLYEQSVADAVASMLGANSAQ